MTPGPRGGSAEHGKHRRSHGSAGGPQGASGPAGAAEDSDEDRAGELAGLFGAERAEDAGRSEPPRAAGPRRVGGGSRGRGRRLPERARRGAGWLVAVAVIVLIAAGAWFGARELLGLGGPAFEDYEGAGNEELIIQVEQGDSTQAIAATLDEADVVASGEAFLAAGEGNDGLRGIQPGSYVMRAQMSGQAAVAAITAGDARVGDLQIRAGTQLDDVELPDGEVRPGALSLMSQASCAEVNDEDTCVEADELRAAAAEAELTELGAPEWMAAAAEQADEERRLEGLIMPGVYNVAPGSDAGELLSTVLASSASTLEAAGLPDSAGEVDDADLDPYEVVVVASLIEREGVQNDFGKISRVIYNRLADGDQLRMDSTINYTLERPEIRTTEEDRAREGPYNTYQNTGLPPTPIAAPSTEALAAAQDPEDGDWTFFNKCEDSGISCFSEDLDEHQENVRDAQERGVF